MKRYTTIHPLFMSFYSRSLYREVKGWKGISFLYLFLLLAVTWIPLTFRISAYVSAFLEHEAPKIVEQVPVITISKGTASVNVEMPYTVREPESGRPLLIIDTTGKASLKNSEAAALLTGTELIVRRDSRETRTLALSEIEDIVIDQSKLYAWIETFSQYFTPVLYASALFFSFLFRIAQALVFSLIGVIFARNLAVPLRYREVLSLAIVSMTPSIIIDTIYQYAGANVPFWWVFTFLVSFGYLFFAVKANAGETRENDTIKERE